MGIVDDIKKSFGHGNNVTRLIYINLGVFVIVNLTRVVLELFNIGNADFMGYLAMPSSFALFLHRPWTILTYMFLHQGFLHVLFNVLFLYWFGRFFLSYYNQKQLVGLYLIGGIMGGIFYLFSYSFFPYFADKSAHLLGASASVLAITIGIAATMPDFEINLMFIGKVKLKYLALVIVLVDLLSVTSFNEGGHVAHLGGAFAGFLYAVLMKKGKDMTSFINKIIDFFANLFKRKPKMKVTHTRKMTDQEYNKKKKQESEEIDAILDKIKKSGYASLTAAEKKKLFDQSQK